jgi:Fic family protein
LGECVAYIRVLREIPLLPEEHKRLLEVSLRRGALATTAIEGNTLTEADLVRIFDQDESPTESMNYQKVEVENIIDAMNIIKDDLLRGSESIIEPELIRELHRLITRNLGEKVDCIPGKFREDNRHVGGIYRAPDYSDVDLLMDRLCRWLRSEFLYPAYVDEYGPIIQAVVAHIYLEWIHPFGDGNGRTGRLLEFYIQVRGGIPVVAATLLSNHYNQTRSEL